MRLPVFALLAALWCGCPELTPPCQRGPVFGGALNRAPLGVVGHEVRFDVTAPLIACASDAVRVDVEAFDEANQPVPVSAGTPSISGGAVTATLSLTPTMTGVYAVRVFFEPSLGNVQLGVVVASEPAVALVDETFPMAMDGCHGGLDRTLSGAVLCSDGVDTIVFRGGVEQQRFAGSELVVVDDVVWTQTAGGVLERRVDVDGGFVVEGTLGGFVPGAGGLLLNEHTRTAAVRSLSLDEVRTAEWDADAGVLLAKAWHPTFSGDYYLLEGDSVWSLSAVGSVSDLGAQNRTLLFTGLAGGVDADGVWLTTGTAIELLRRPFDPAAARMQSLPLPLGLELASFDGVSPEVVPSLSAGSPTTLIPVVRGASLGVERWAFDVVPVRIGRRWIILRGASGQQLRFQRRPDATQ